MIYRIFIVFTISLFIGSALAQHNEIGLFGGGSYYIGDLNPSAHFSQTKPAAGLIYRHHFNARVSIRGQVMHGSIEGSDAKSKFNIQRNLSFRSELNEAAAIIEINFLPYLPGKLETIATTYVFGGISVFHFNPKAEYQGTWYDLQPLRTEGEKKPYPLYNVSIPFGLGCKLNLAKRISAAIEWGLRMTFTDYLDDVSTVYVDLSQTNISNFPNLADRSPEINEPPNLIHSQRGNSRNNDWYSFFGISVTYKIKDVNAPCHAFPEEKRTKVYSRIIDLRHLNLFNNY